MKDLVDICFPISWCDTPDSSNSSEFPHTLLFQIQHMRPHPRGLQKDPSVSREEESICVARFSHISQGVGAHWKGYKSEASPPDLGPFARRLPQS